MRNFKKVYIEISNVCNLKCDFCPQTSRKPEFMNIDTFSKILDQIKEHTNFIYFHVKGEPLLHPEIGVFLDVSHEKGFKVNITTNGTLINTVKDKLLMKPALRQVNFSLHSMDGNEVFQNKEEYIDHILSFTKEATDKSEVLISLRLWNLDENNIVNLERKRNNELLETIKKEFDLTYKIEEKVISGRGIKITDQIYLNQDHQFQWPDLKEKEDEGSSFCYGLRNQVAILVDGTVVPCCLDGEGIISLGNIKVNHFSELIESERARNIVEGFSRREAVEELCRKCGFSRRFGR